MPRKPRLDIPGHLYHVVARGNERKAIFYGQDDYHDFLRRLRLALGGAGAKCLAWCLMPNHFHLLILRGSETLSGLMRHLMTGYAVGFNIRHRRCGHLFQNRYKAILCAEDDYMIGLIAYIHLNPRRAGLVENMAKLAEYRWCGHGAMLGTAPTDFLDREYALNCFGKTENEAKVKYLDFLEDCYARQKTGEYSGGGFLKSLAAPGGPASLRRVDPKELSDARALGAGNFVETVLREAEQPGRASPSRDEIRVKVLKDFGVDFLEILSGSRERRISKARAAYCYLIKERCGIDGGEISKELTLSSGGLSRLVARGKAILYSRQISKKVSNVPRISKKVSNVP